MARSLRHVRVHASCVSLERTPLLNQAHAINVMPATSHPSTDLPYVMSAPRADGLPQLRRHAPPVLPAGARMQALRRAMPARGGRSLMKAAPSAHNALLGDIQTPRQAHVWCVRTEHSLVAPARRVPSVGADVGLRGRLASARHVLVVDGLALWPARARHASLANRSNATATASPAQLQPQRQPQPQPQPFTHRSQLKP